VLIQSIKYEGLTESGGHSNALRQILNPYLKNIFGLNPFSYVVLKKAFWKGIILALGQYFSH